MSTTSRHRQSTGSMLYVSLELGSTTWVVVSTTSMAQGPRRKHVRAGDTSALRTEIDRARSRFGLLADAPIHSCYEAGRDGFWLHRWLIAHDVHNGVVDSASIRVTRRRREAKTDRIDAEALVRMPIRFLAGEAKVWSVVQAPAPEVEDRRQVNREWDTVKADRRRLLIALWHHVAHGLVPEGATLRSV